MQYHVFIASEAEYDYKSKTETKECKRKRLYMVYNTRDTRIKVKKREVRKLECVLR